MSKYNHFEMCEKIFGQKYKWNEHKQDYESYSRTDMWDKLVEQQQEIEKLNTSIVFYKSYYISFHEKVIYELEKVREKLIEKLQNIDALLDSTEYELIGRGYKNSIEEINNQINQLKCEVYHEQNN